MARDPPPSSLSVEYHTKEPGKQASFGNIAAPNLIETHETLASVDPGHRIGTLRGGMIAKVFRLILAKLRIRPIRSLDVLHALEQGRSRDVHFAKDGILILIAVRFWEWGR